MYCNHLQDLLKDFKVTVIRDNHGSHSKSRANKRSAIVHRRSCSDPGEIILLGVSNNERKKKCRWQSAPAKKASDMAPVLKRSVDGPTVSLTSLHVAFRPETVSKKDQPPTFRRSTEKPLSLLNILDQIDALRIDDFEENFVVDHALVLGETSSHTV